MQLKKNRKKERKEKRENNKTQRSANPTSPVCVRIGGWGLSSMNVYLLLLCAFKIFIHLKQELRTKLSQMIEEMQVDYNGNGKFKNLLSKTE